MARLGVFFITLFFVDLAMSGIIKKPFGLGLGLSGIALKTALAKAKAKALFLKSENPNERTFGEGDEDDDDELVGGAHMWSGHLPNHEYESQYRATDPELGVYPEQQFDQQYEQQYRSYFPQEYEGPTHYRSYENEDLAPYRTHEFEQPQEVQQPMYYRAYEPAYQPQEFENQYRDFEYNQPWDVEGYRIPDANEKSKHGSKSPSKPSSVPLPLPPAPPAPPKIKNPHPSPVKPFPTKKQNHEGKPRTMDEMQQFGPEGNFEAQYHSPISEVQGYEEPNLGLMGPQMPENLKTIDGSHGSRYSHGYGHGSYGGHYGHGGNYGHGHYGHGGYGHGGHGGYGHGGHGHSPNYGHVHKHEYDYHYTAY